MRVGRAVNYGVQHLEFKSPIQSLTYGAHYFFQLLFPQLSNRGENINIAGLVVGRIQNNMCWVLNTEVGTWQQT